MTKKFQHFFKKLRCFMAEKDSRGLFHQDCIFIEHARVLFYRHSLLACISSVFSYKISDIAFGRQPDILNWSKGPLAIFVSMFFLLPGQEKLTSSLFYQFIRKRLSSYVLRLSQQLYLKAEHVCNFTLFINQKRYSSHITIM